MEPSQFPSCPHCGSNDVIPFEEDTGKTWNVSLTVVIISALVLLGGYFLFILSSYLYFPVFILFLIIIAAKWVGNTNRERRQKRSQPRDYMCLECSQFFRG